ncbi:MAG: ComF family protein [Kiritimatiellae bacterium]|nr:ComF family protein [Kiritimatiellia bacterium]
MGDWARTAGRRLLDLVWPRGCEVCGRPVDRESRYVCADCLNRIPFIKPGDGVYEIDDAVSAVRFECETRQMVLDYKFNSHIWLRDDFVDWLAAAADARFDLAAVDLVLPMPSTVLHRLDRGYNPCAYLAEDLARRIDRRCPADVLARQGHPARQSGLSEEERLENVKGTFAVRRPEFVSGRTVLVVDDILTTGATLAECAKTLKAAGAWRVWSATLARAVRT